MVGMKASVWQAPLGFGFLCGTHAGRKRKKRRNSYLYKGLVSSTKLSFNRHMQPAKDDKSFDDEFKLCGKKGSVLQPKLRVWL